MRPVVMRSSTFSFTANVPDDVRHSHTKDIQAVGDYLCALAGRPGFSAGFCYGHTGLHLTVDYVHCGQAPAARALVASWAEGVELTYRKFWRFVREEPAYSCNGLAHAWIEYVGPYRAQEGGAS